MKAPRFRFRLRLLLATTAILAVAMGFWAKRANDQQEVIDQVVELGGNVSYWHDRANPKCYMAPAWIRRSLGEKWFVRVYSVDLQSLYTLTDEQIPRLDILRDMERLNLDDTQVGDQTVAMAARLPHLRHLNLMQTDVSDQGLRQLRDCSSLYLLSLGGCDISEDGLEHLRELENLKFLSIEQTKVTELPPWMRQRDDLRVTSAPWAQ